MGLLSASQATSDRRKRLLLDASVLSGGHTQTPVEHRSTSMAHASTPPMTLWGLGVSMNQTAAPMLQVRSDTLPAQTRSALQKLNVPGFRFMAFSAVSGPTLLAQHSLTLRVWHAAVANATHSWDYCAAATTLSGCKCHPHWTLNNKHYYGTSLDDGDVRGPWCVVDRATCPGFRRAHQYGASNTITATVNGQAGNLTGLDFDYTKQITVSGCKCRNPWTYDGVTYYGTCRQGVKGNKTLPGFSADATWCYIDEGCKGSGDWEGYRFDVCTPDGGRVASDGSACQLPTTYEGVPMYNCLDYQHDTGSTTQPWCFAADGTVRVCAPWTCSGPVKIHCPATDPSTPGADLSGWTAQPCLQALCGARQALVNVTQCTTDTADDKAMLQQSFQFLNGSSTFGQLLTSSGGPGEVCLKVL